MDSHDRKELSVMSATGVIPATISRRLKAEIKRQQKEHIKKYDSILMCPDRKTICAFMFGAWEIGCQRVPCIKDDLEDIALQKHIEIKRAAQEKEQHHDEQAAPIRNQTGRIKSYRRMKLDEIHRLEEQSREAYHNNRPSLGDTLFNRARFLRGELKKWEDERKKAKDAIDSL